MVSMHGWLGWSIKVGKQADPEEKISNRKGLKSGGWIKLKRTDMPPFGWHTQPRWPGIRYADEEQACLQGYTRSALIGVDQDIQRLK